jgi:hypothetical protein
VASQLRSRLPPRPRSPRRLYLPHAPFPSRRLRPPYAAFRLRLARSPFRSRHLRSLYAPFPSRPPRLRYAHVRPRRPPARWPPWCAAWPASTRRVWGCVAAVVYSGGSTGRRVNCLSSVRRDRSRQRHHRATAAAVLTGTARRCFSHARKMQAHGGPAREVCGWDLKQTAIWCVIVGREHGTRPASESSRAPQRAQRVVVFKKQSVRIHIRQAVVSAH